MNVGAAWRGGLRALTVAWLALLLGACGFHLRGQAHLPAQMARTYVAGLAADAPLRWALDDALRASGVRVVDSERAASAVLRVESLRSTRSVLSVSADGQVSDYLLVGTLTFAVRATQGDWRIPTQRLQVQRHYSYSDSQVLGKSSEAARLREDMARELANLVLLRLQAHSGP